MLPLHYDRIWVTGVRIALTDVKGMNLPSHFCSIPARFLVTDGNRSIAISQAGDRN
jgi:hypothetical protein